MVVCESVPSTVSGYATWVPFDPAVAITGARYSRFT